MPRDHDCPDCERMREAMFSAAELVSELDELCDNLPADLDEALLFELQPRAAPAVNFWVSNCVRGSGFSGLSLPSQLTATMSVSTRLTLAYLKRHS